VFPARVGLGALLLFGAALVPAGPAWAQARPAEPKPSAPSAQDCLACHADKDLKRSAPAPGRPDSLFVDAAALKASPHSRLECVGCHATATAPHDSPLPPVRCAACHDKSRAALGEAAFAAAWEEGKKMTLEQAVEYALEGGSG